MSLAVVRVAAEHPAAASSRWPHPSRNSPDEAITALRRTSPAGSNAVETLRRVQAIDPDNEAARERLGRVVAKYIDLADRALAAGDPAMAGVYLDSADGVETGTEAVALARERLPAAGERAATSRAPRSPHSPSHLTR